MQHVDGNALAGSLAQIIPFDLTTAVGRCRGCGASGMVGDTMVYFASPGVIIRCAHCDAVLATLVETSTKVWLSLAGISGLQVPAR